MEEIESVDGEALANLAQHFASGGAWVPVQAERPDPDDVPRYETIWRKRFELPGFEGERSVIGTDGSVSPGSSYGSFAAVSADGYVTVGVFEGPSPNSGLAEMMAVRYALRQSGLGHVTLLLDNMQVVDAVKVMSRGRIPRNASFQDRESLQEIVNLLMERQVTVRHVPDIEGTTASYRMPSQPLMATAHRLCWCARRMAIDGLELNGPGLDFMKKVAVLRGRSTPELRDRYRNWLQGSGIEI